MMNYTGRGYMHFLSFTGIVTGIHRFETGMHGGMIGCMQIFTVENEQGQIVNFVVEPETYFVHHETIKVGDRITGFYDGDAPAILIYPPQYPAIVIAKESQHYFVKVSFFNEALVSADGQLKLTIGRDTVIRLENAQRFQGSLANRNLIVLFGPTTRSIPAQTTPFEIIVICQ